MNARQNRIRTVASALVLAAVLATAPVARAHHSAAAFDRTQTVSLEGVVTRYEWKSPHVYLWLAAPGADGATVEWEVEGQPPAVLRRVGWSQDTFKVGDRIEATGHPARNAQRKGLLLASLKRAGTTLFDGPSMTSAVTTPATPEVAADSIAGVWVTLLDPAAMQTYIFPGQRVPLTQAGIAARNAYDEVTMNPGLKCIPPPAPALMVVPDVKRITFEDGLIRIAGEFAAGERVIHLAETTSTEAATPSVQGHSVGRWDGATLVVETTNFTPLGGGIGLRLPSSPKKTLVERLTLDADGKGLTYAYELADPEMLTGPITSGGRWVYSPDVEFAPVACDLENARRFTQ
jgi:hypothetical protein